MAGTKNNKWSLSPSKELEKAKKKNLSTLFNTYVTDSSIEPFQAWQNYLYLIDKSEETKAYNISTELFANYYSDLITQKNGESVAESITFILKNYNLISTNVVQKVVIAALQELNKYEGCYPEIKAALTKPIISALKNNPELIQPFLSSSLPLLNRPNLVLSLLRSRFYQWNYRSNLLQAMKSDEIATIALQNYGNEEILKRLLFKPFFFQPRPSFVEKLNPEGWAMLLSLQSGKHLIIAKAYTERLKKESSSQFGDQVIAAQAELKTKLLGFNAEQSTIYLAPQDTTATYTEEPAATKHDQSYANVLDDLEPSFRVDGSSTPSGSPRKPLAPNPNKNMTPVDTTANYETDDDEQEEAPPVPAANYLSSEIEEPKDKQAPSTPLNTTSNYVSSETSEPANVTSNYTSTDKTVVSELRK